MVSSCFNPPYCHFMGEFETEEMEVCDADGARNMVPQHVAGEYHCLVYPRHFQTAGNSVPLLMPEENAVVHAELPECHQEYKLQQQQQQNAIQESNHIDSEQLRKRFLTAFQKAYASGKRPAAIIPPLNRRWKTEVVHDRRGLSTDHTALPQNPSDGENCANSLYSDTDIASIVQDHEYDDDGGEEEIVNEEIPEEEIDYEEQEIDEEEETEGGSVNEETEEGSMDEETEEGSMDEETEGGFVNKETEEGLMNEETEEGLMNEEIEERLMNKEIERGGGGLRNEEEEEDLRNEEIEEDLINEETEGGGIVNEEIEGGEILDEETEDGIMNREVVEGGIIGEEEIYFEEEEEIYFEEEIDDKEIMKEEVEGLENEKTEEQEEGLMNEEIEEGITNREVVAGGITNREVVAGGITNGEVVAGGITNKEVVAGGITNKEVIAGGITNKEVVAGGITNGEVVAGGLRNREVAAGGIRNGEVVARGIRNGEGINNRAVVGGVIRNGVVVRGGITSRTVVGEAITNGTVGGGGITNGVAVGRGIRNLVVIRGGIKNLIVGGGGVTIQVVRGGGTANGAELKPPPIILHIKDHYRYFLQLLKEWTTEDFSVRTAGKDLIRVNFCNIADYKRVESEAAARQILFYTHTTHSDKVITAVFRGLPHTFQPHHLWKELEELGFAVHFVVRMKYPKTGREMPLFLVVVPETPQNRKIFSITLIANTIISVENLKRRRGGPRCSRCQAIGHMAHHCSQLDICIQCASEHQSQKCLLPGKKALKFMNCGAHQHEVPYSQPKQEKANHSVCHLGPTALPHVDLISDVSKAKLLSSSDTSFMGPTANRCGQTHAKKRMSELQLDSAPKQKLRCPHAAGEAEQEGLVFTSMGQNSSRNGTSYFKGEDSVHAEGSNCTDIMHSNSFTTAEQLSDIPRQFALLEETIRNLPQRIYAAVKMAVETGMLPASQQSAD
ncbi:uncharacterized protein LOC126285185 [Schistocerca gregaria]|uniref:uncharacterized protein LOC126285185 n=1 Tax=Schistocerca gregaria TaxID=7010 RepID=UPI00211E8185|nr:uncharacterized protein LOC126285185 [Schistocerca gregaria]